MRQDIRHGIRLMLKNPAFTAVAVLSLALGIGANGAIFSIVNALLLRPLPVRNPGELVALYGKRADTGAAGTSHSYPDYLDYRDQNQALSGIAAYFPIQPLSLSTGDQAERIWGQLVAGNYFDVLGVTPVWGRGFLPEEDRSPGAYPVAVLSHGLWRRRFSSDPSIVGRSILLNGRSFTVVGIAPEGFVGADLGFNAEVWVPLMMHAQLLRGEDRLTSRGRRWLDIIGRLKPGITRGQAQAQLTGIARRLEEQYPDTNKGRGVQLERAGAVRPEVRGAAIGFSALLMAVVALVLLIACANVANLLMARTAAREREIAIRLAIGAGRSRLIRQLLTESLLLSVLGGGLGLLVARWVTRAISAFQLPLPFPIQLDLSLDYRVLGFLALVSILTGIGFGLAPAFKAVGSRRRAEGRAGGVLATAQIALSLVLLMSAGLFLRSLQNANAIDVGFQADNILMLSTDPSLNGYTASQSKAFFRQLLERVQTLSGVRSASVIDVVPLGMGGSATGVTVEGRETPPQGRRVEYAVVAVKYFETMGIALVRGRDFSTADDERSVRVAMINETMARRFWAGEDPMGRWLRDGPVRRQVIGIVKDSQYRNVGEASLPCMYVPVSQDYEPTLLGMTLLVRTAGNPRAMLGPVLAQVRNLDPHLAVFNIKTMNEHRNNALFLPRVGATLFGAFGLLGLVLAAVGLYGVMSYAVSRRTREIGVRMALGATGADVVTMVLKRGLAVTTIGVAVGLAGSLALTRFTGRFLYGLSPTDPATFVSVPVFLAAVALLASYIPAHRAARVEPMVALRYE